MSMIDGAPPVGGEMCPSMTCKLDRQPENVSDVRIDFVQHWPGSKWTTYRTARLGFFNWETQQTEIKAAMRTKRDALELDGYEVKSIFAWNSGPANHAGIALRAKRYAPPQGDNSAGAPY